MAVTPRDPATVPGLDGRSRWIDLDGPLHYLDLGGPAGASVVVCVHGLSGSAVNWSAIAPLLTDRYRLLAPDLAGRGQPPHPDLPGPADRAGPAGPRRHGDADGLRHARPRPAADGPPAPSVA